MDDPCEVCNGTERVAVAGDGPVYDPGRGWHFLPQIVPCPECTDEGRAWAEREAEEAQTEYWADRAREVAPG